MHARASHAEQEAHGLAKLFPAFARKTHDDVQLDVEAFADGVQHRFLEPIEFHDFLDPLQHFGRTALRGVAHVATARGVEQTTDFRVDRFGPVPLGSCQVNFIFRARINSVNSMIQLRFTIAVRS